MISSFQSGALYCHLIAYIQEEKQQRYHNAIKRELERFLTGTTGYSLSTIYIKMSNGCYPDHLLLDMAGTLSSIFGLKDYAELTLELTANMPITEDLSCWKKAGVNRINISGALHNNLDSFIGRANLLGKQFDNIALDVYVENALDRLHWSAVVDRLIALPISHVALTCSDNLGDWLIDFFDFFKTRLCSAGFDQYELYCFARKGLQSKYMHHLWDQKLLYGVGAGAQSSVARLRYNNESDATRYVEMLEQRGVAIRYVEQISSTHYAAEKLMLNLRRKEGVVIEQVLRELSEEAKDYFLEQITLLDDSGLINCSNGRCVLTSKGQFHEEEIVQRLI